jgi:hypothetical protein
VTSFSESASVSSPSISRSCRSLTASSASPSCFRSLEAPGRVTATSTRARFSASGVRISWDALATNRRCPSKDRSSRSSISSNVSASSLTSSRGPTMPIRSCSPRPAEPAAIRRAVSVIRCTGDSARPASSQPNPPASRPTTSSAMPPWVSTDSSVSVRNRCWAASTSLSNAARLPGDQSGPPAAASRSSATPPSGNCPRVFRLASTSR